MEVAAEVLERPLLVSMRRRYEHICEQLTAYEGKLGELRPWTEIGIRLLKSCRNAALGDLVAAEREALFEHPPRWMRQQ